MNQVYSPAQRELEQKILRKIKEKQSPEKYRKTKWCRRIYDTLNPRDLRIERIDVLLRHPTVAIVAEPPPRPWHELASAGIEHW